jgi:UDP-N-acetyl-D-mannosaminuronate dehydrogenase
LAASRTRIGVLGLTFKENVPDVRNSKVPDIVAELADHGATVLVHDPHVSEEEARAYFFDHSLRQKPAAAAVLRACPEAWPAIFKARRPLRRAVPRRSGV